MDKRDIKSGSSDTFLRLLFRNERRIYAYIFVLVPDRVEAEDLFQETLSVMWSKFDSFDRERDFGAWGMGIAFNIVRNYRKKKARSRLHLDDDIENLLEHEARQSMRHLDGRIEALRKCLTHLDPLDRKILRLRYEDNTTIETIAANYSSTMKVIYTKLARAHDFLFRCIRRTVAEEGG